MIQTNNWSHDRYLFRFITQNFLPKKSEVCFVRLSWIKDSQRRRRLLHFVRKDDK